VVSGDEAYQEDAKRFWANIPNTKQHTAWKDRNNRTKYSAVKKHGDLSQGVKSAPSLKKTFRLCCHNKTYLRSRIREFINRSVAFSHGSTKGRLIVGFLCLQVRIAREKLRQSSQYICTQWRNWRRGKPPLEKLNVKSGPPLVDVLIFSLIRFFCVYQGDFVFFYLVWTSRDSL